MKKLLLLTLVVFSVMLAPLGNMYADGSKAISFQGVLLDQDGKPLNDVLPVRFELYDAQYGGNQLWGETQSVTFEDGYFNVYLGAENPLDLMFNEDYYLQITVADGTPYDRTALSYSPYAFSAETAKLADLAQDIPDGSVTLVKLADEVKIITGDIEGTLPELYLAEGAVKRNIQPGDIETWMLSKNVSLPPSGPASGDLTGTYPDPKIADEAVTSRTIQTGAITWSKLQTPLNTTPGTILGWNGSMWVETDVPTWEVGRLKDVITGRGLYTEADADGFLDVGIADDGVVNEMIIDQAITLPKLQDPMNTAPGTIIGWDGTAWVETDVPTWEIARVKDVIPGRGLYTEVDADGFYNVGIEDGGIVSSMIGDGEVQSNNLADGAVELSKLEDGTALGQVMYWDGTEWRFNEKTPHRSHVLKWDFNADSTSMEMQWAQDAMSIPFYYGGESTDINDNEITMFTLEKNFGDPNADDNILELIVNHKDANSALVAVGSGVDSPNSTNREVATIYGESDLGFKEGVVGVMADVSSLDLNDPDAYSVAGLFIHNTNGLDNGYKSGAVAGYTQVDQASTGTHHTGIFGEVNIDAGGGHAKGVIGQAWANAADVNVGVLGTSRDAQNISVGVAGLNNAPWTFFDDMFAPGNIYDDINSIGVLAYNSNDSDDDISLFAISEGDAPAAGFVAEDAPSIIAMNNSATEATIEAMNLNGSAAMLIGDIGNSEYAAYVDNMNADGRGMLIESTSPTAFPYNWPGDPADIDEATLVVRNNDASANRIAIKTYGDIVANSAVYASMFVANDSIVIGTPGNSITIKAPENPGDPLVFEGDVDVDGTLNVSEDIFAEGIISAPTGDFEVLNVSDAINASTATAAFGATTTGELTATGYFIANSGATIDGGLVVDEVQINGELIGEDAYFTGTLTADGMTELVDLGGGYLFSATEDYDGLGNPGVVVDGDIATSGNVLNPMPPTVPLHLTNKAYVDAQDAALQANIDAEEAARIAADNALGIRIDDEEAARIAGDDALDLRIDNILDVGATFDGVYDLSGTMNVSGTLQPDGGTVLANAYEPTADLTATDADFAGDLYVEGEAGILDDGLGGYVFQVMDDAGAGVAGAALFGDLVVIGDQLLMGEIGHYGDYDLYIGDLTVEMGDVNVDMGNVVNPTVPSLDDHLTNKLYVDTQDAATLAAAEAYADAGDAATLAAAEAYADAGDATINDRIDDILNVGAEFSGDYDLSGTFDLSGTMTVSNTLQPDGIGGVVLANAYDANSDITATNADFLGDLYVDGQAGILDDGLGGYVFEVTDDFGLGDPGALVSGDFGIFGDFLLIGDADHIGNFNLLTDDLNVTSGNINVDMGNVINPTVPTLDDHLTNKLYVDDEIADALASINADAPVTYDPLTSTIGFDYDSDNFDLNLNDELAVKEGGITTLEIFDGTILNEDIADATIANAKLVNSSLDVEAGNGLSTTNATIALGGTATLDVNVDGATIEVNAGDNLAVMEDGITNRELAVDAVETENILDLNVTTGKLAADAVDNSKLADDAVQTENILNANVTNAKLANSNVTVNANAGLTTDLATIELGQTANLSVNVDGATIEVNAGDNLAVMEDGITNRELAVDAVETENILDLNVTTGKLAADAVVNSKLADDAVQTENIVDLNVTTGKLAADAVVNSKLADDAVQTENIVDLNVTTDKLAADAVVNSKLADDAVQTENILDLNVTTGKLAADAVVNSKLADDAVQTENILDLNVTTGKLAADAVDNTKLADDAVQTENIVDLNVTTDKLAADAVDNSKLADDAVQTENILDANVTNAKLANSTVTITPGNGLLTDGDGTLALGETEIYSVDVAGLAGNGLVENAGAFDVNTDASLQVVADQVGLDLANSNTWTANQTFPTAYAENFETTNGNFKLSQSAADNVPWANAINTATGNAVMELGYGTDGSSANAEYGISFNDATTGNLRAGMGYNLGNWSVGVSNDGGDMAGVMTSGADNNMNLGVIKDGAFTFVADIDGNVTANDLTVNDVTANSLTFDGITVVDAIETTLTDDDTHLPTSGAVVDAINTLAASVNLQGVYDNGNTIALADANGNVALSADNAYTGTEMLDIAFTQNTLTQPISALDVTLDGAIIDTDQGATRVQANLGVAVNTPLNGSTKQIAGVAAGVMAGGTPLTYATLGMQEVSGATTVNYAGYFVNNSTSAADIAVRIDQEYYGTALEVRTLYTDPIGVGSIGSTINEAVEGSAGSFTTTNTSNGEATVTIQSQGNNGTGLKVQADGSDSKALEVIGNGSSIGNNPAMYVVSNDNANGQAIHAVNESGAETVLIQQTGTGNGLTVSTDNTNGRTADFSNTGIDGGVASFRNTDATNDVQAVTVVNSGTSAALYVDGAENALTINKGSVVLSTNTVTTNAIVADDLQYNVIVITYATNNAYSLPVGTAGQILYVINGHATANHTVEGNALNNGESAMFIYANSQWFKLN